MLPVNTKIARNQLRHDFLQGAWRSFSWSSDILAIECQDGWAGRNPTEHSLATIVIYIQKKLSEYKLKACIKYLQTICKRPFYAYHIVWDGRNIKQNRLPHNDTQDRFWLLNDLSFLTPSNWNYWVSTNQGWGTYFTPSVKEITKIYEDAVLFKRMLEGEYRYYMHFDMECFWMSQIQKHFDVFKTYATLLQVHKLPDTYILDEDEYVAYHLNIREQALNPEYMVNYTLPSIV